MPRTRLAVSTAALLGALFSAAACADMEIHAQVDRREVGVGEELVLSVTVSGGFQNLPSPQLPEMEGFTVYPSGSSTSFSLVNGRVTSTKTSRYVLVPQQEGTLTIPPIAVVHGGDEYTTDPIEIQVSATPQGSPSPQQTVPSPAPGGSQAAGDALLLKASLDKKRVYVNEQLTLTLRFYRRVALAGSRLVPPVTKGFWVEQLPGEKNYYAVENGLQYAVTEISTALFPTTDGLLTVEPATWECAIREQIDPFSMDPFDLFNSARTRDVSVKSESLQVEVAPLPAEGKPPKFDGAVGKFSLGAQVDRSQVAVEEPLSLTVKVSGVGNVNAVGDLDMPEVAGFREYDSGGSVDLSKDGGVIHGSKSFSRVFIPSVPGEYVIPGISFAYFNPAEGRYAVASSGEIPVKVVAGEGVEASATVPPADGAPVTKDIRYIKTGMPSFSRVGDRLYQRTSFLMLQMLAPLMVVLVYAYRAARERAGANPARGRSRRARGRAVKRVAEARSLARAGALDRAWKTLSESLRGYIADVLDSSPRGLTIEDVRQGLSLVGVGDDLVGETVGLLERCDATAYAPGDVSIPSPQDTLGAVKDLVSRIEKARRNR